MAVLLLVLFLITLAFNLMMAQRAPALPGGGDVKPAAASAAQQISMFGETAVPRTPGKPQPAASAPPAPAKEPPASTGGGVT